MRAEHLQGASITPQGDTVSKQGYIVAMARSGTVNHNAYSVYNRVTGVAQKRTDQMLAR